MRIGCNWSKALQHLLDAQVIDVDYVKAGAYGDFDQNYTMMRQKPILLHGLGYMGHTGMVNLHEVDFDRVNRLIRDCDSPHYGLHLAIEKKNMPDGMTLQAMDERMSHTVQTFKQSMQVPILLENTSDTVEDRTYYDFYPYIEPEHLSRMIVDNDVYMLLDITHAKLTARFNGWDVKDYIRGLPLERIRELHVNGSGVDANGDIADTHASMEGEDYDLLQWVLTQSTPDIVTLEYVGVRGESEDTIIESLRTQIDQIRRITGRD